MKTNNNTSFAKIALRKELTKIFDAPRFRSFVNDLTISLADDVVAKVKKTNPNGADFVGAARNVLCEKLSSFIINHE